MTATYDDFIKLDIRIGRVVSAEPVPGAKKLLKLIIDVGGENKQCIAGIGLNYTAEDLLNKSVAVVINLAPKKLFGLESEVMLLAAVEGDILTLLKPDRDIAAGAKVA
ncbi:MAG: methionine--tRNA ligase subunit beta [Thaumarchaeota archaeon]|nr:methionine--tRNA ligase subunit beta [Nitrososphaerota archaeon]